MPSGATSSDPPPAGAAGHGAARFELPDLCSPVAVTGVVIACELLAVLLTLARTPGWSSFYAHLPQAAVLLLWIGLASAALLCRLRPWLTRHAVLAGSVLAFLVVLGVVVGVSEAAFWLGRALGAGPDTGGNWFPTGRGPFLARNLAIAALVMGPVLRYFYLHTEHQRNVRREADARLAALQARIRPHFLFNSMNTIAALTRDNPAAAEQAVEDLADLFRASLAEGTQLIPLGDELDIARVYERIERHRLGDRLQIDWHVEDLPPGARMPGLTLQPLLENAIYHGIEPSSRPGQIAVHGRVAGDRIEIEVSNPLPGDGGKPRRGGHRLALDNIRERLALAYGDRAGLTTRHDGGRFTATLHFPGVLAA
ncbi:MAG: sensor histidine kinase [Chromatiales bacterium]|nr:sensor histidine kinase [Chromatiales bacterium]